MIEYTEDEKAGLVCLAREYELGRHHLGDMWSMFIQAIGQPFVKDWRKRDAIDPDVWEGPDGPVMTNGWRYGATPEQAQNNKWSCRVRLWTEGRYEDIRHVRDWLSVAAIEVHAWTQVRDEHGDVVKLKKSLDHLIATANKSLERRQRAQRNVPKLTDADERIVMDLVGGYKLVRLLSTQALVVEGAFMSHCIGQGGYARKLEHALMQYFSIRDADGKPAATLEVVVNGDRLVPWVSTCDGVTPDYAGRIEQFHGRRNTAPDSEVEAALEAALPHLGWQHWHHIRKRMAEALEEHGRNRNINEINTVVDGDPAPPEPRWPM